MLPSLFDIPIFTITFYIPLITFDNNSHIRPLIFVDKFFKSKGFCVNRINITGTIMQLHDRINLIIFFISPFFQLDISYSNTVRYDLSFFLAY